MNEPRWHQELITGKGGAPLALLANALTVLRNAPEWRGVLAYDEFSQGVSLLLAPPWGGDIPRAWRDVDTSRCLDWLQRTFGIHIRGTQTIAEAVDVVARERAFHPVRDYLNQLKWDGQPRIDTWLSVYLGATERLEWVHAIGPRWLIGAVARIFRPGCQVDSVLMLQGKQGALKSSALRTLASDAWFSDHIDGSLGDKDSRAALHGNWIVEWAELTHMRAAEFERVKAYLTTRFDYYRRPYGHLPERVPRSNVFAGSTNEDAPLQDATGNRRFWPVDCGVIDLEGLKRDRDQLWAEAVVAYHVGRPWWLETAELDELAATEQDARRECDAWEPKILSWIEDPQPSRFGGDWYESKPGRVSVQDILLHCLEISVDRHDPKASGRVIRTLTANGWRRKQVRVGEGRANKRRWYYVRNEEQSPRSPVDDEGGDREW